MTTFSNGASTVTVGDDAVVNGMFITRLEQGSRQRVRQLATSPFVDDEFEVNSRLGGLRLAVDLYIEGTNWADIVTKRTNLLAVVESVTWTLTTPTATYSCWAADSSSPTPPHGTVSDYRVIQLDIPVRQQLGV